MAHFNVSDVAMLPPTASCLKVVDGAHTGEVERSSNFKISILVPRGWCWENPAANTNEKDH